MINVCPSTSEKQITWRVSCYRFAGVSHFVKHLRLKEIMMINTFKFLAVPALLAISGVAGAAITEQTTVNFQNIAAATYGKSNAVNGDVTVGGSLNQNGTNCVGGNCYVESGVVISTIYDESDAGSGAHLHRAGTTANRSLHTHGDAAGVYIRLTDGSAFSFESINISSPYSENNPYAKFLDDGVTPNPDWSSLQDVFVIKGFNSAYNPDLWQNNYSGLVAETSAYIGFDGVFDVLAANPAFANVNAVWIYSAGRYNADLAGQRDFDVKYDNITLNAPVAPVPVPGAIWLFGSALMAFAGRSKRRNTLTA